MTGGGALSNSDHLRTLDEESRDGQKDREVANKTKTNGLVRYLKDTNRRLILRVKITGVWLSLRGTTVSGTVFLLWNFNIYYAHIIMPPRVSLSFLLQ